MYTHTREVWKTYMKLREIDEFQNKRRLWPNQQVGTYYVSKIL